MKRQQEKQQNTSQVTDQQVVDVFDNPEPWAPIETKLVAGSFILAFILLIVFGFLINKYLLHAI